MVDALREAGRAESGTAIEDRVADATAGREAFFGHGHAQARDAALGYEDPGTVPADLVGHIEALELRDDLAAIGWIEVAVKDRHLLVGETARHEHEEGQKPDRHGAQSRQPRRTEPRHRLKERCHRPYRPVVRRTRTGRTSSGTGKLWPAA